MFGYSIIDMRAEQFTENFWYSAMYPSGYSIIFQVIDISNGEATLCRKDGEIIDTVPAGYLDILPHGEIEPDYQ